MKLFVDDFRTPPDDTWVVARSYGDAVARLSHERFDRVSLDYDLIAGEDENGCDVVLWMAENLAAEEWPATVEIHTANELGREEIAEALRDGAPRRTHVRHVYAYHGLGPDGVDVPDDEDELIEDELLDDLGLVDPDAIDPDTAFAEEFIAEHFAPDEY